MILHARLLWKKRSAYILSFLKKNILQMMHFDVYFNKSWYKK